MLWEPFLGAKHRGEAAPSSSPAGATRLTRTRVPPGAGQTPAAVHPPPLSFPIKTPSVQFGSVRVGRPSPPSLPLSLPPRPAEGRALTRGAERPLLRSFLSGGRRAAAAWASGAGRGGLGGRGGWRPGTAPHHAAGQRRRSPTCCSARGRGAGGAAAGAAAAGRWRSCEYAD